MTTQWFKINETCSRQFFNLRWVFHYSDGTVKRGMWNDSIQGDRGTSANMQTKTGILHACIEAEDVNAVIKTVAECSGQDFRMFQWKAEANMNMAARGGGQDGKMHTRTTGLVLHSTKSVVTAYFNGLISVEDAPDFFHDNLFHYGRT